MNTFPASPALHPMACLATNQPEVSGAGTLQNVSALGGRVLLSVLFLVSGLGKIGAYAGTAAYMSALGAPAALLAGVLFHRNFADQIQAIMFLKNVAIAGGLLLLVANGAGTLSLDRRFAQSTDWGN